MAPWARSHWSHTDLTRLKKGRISAQVSPVEAIIATQRAPNRAGDLCLSLSLSSAKLALEIPFGLLNSPASSIHQISMQQIAPQIVLQSVYRFRVIFELVSSSVSCSIVVEATFVRALLPLFAQLSANCWSASGSLSKGSSIKKQIENEQKLIMAHSGSPTLTCRCCYRLDSARASDALIIFAMQCFLLPPPLSESSC